MRETMVTVVGTVITEVTARSVGEGATVANFRIASNERRYDRASGEWADGDSLYVSVSCWRRLAENVAATIVKGDPVVLSGRLFTRSYQQDGQPRSVMSLEAFAVGPDLTRCRATIDRTARQSVKAAEEIAAATPGESSSRRPEAPSVGAVDPSGESWRTVSDLVDEASESQLVAPTELAVAAPAAGRG